MSKEYIRVGYYVFNNGDSGFFRMDEVDEIAEEKAARIIERPHHMLSEHFYTFKNNKLLKMTHRDAKRYCVMFNTEIIKGGPLGYSTTDIYRGFNPGLGVEVRDKAHHKQLLKERGLVEVGNSRDSKQVDRKKTNLIDDSAIKEAVDRGAEISGNEAAALKSGDLKPKTID